jgi:hypothetical protein
LKNLVRRNKNTFTLDPIFDTTAQKQRGVGMGDSWRGGELRISPSPRGLCKQIETEKNKEIYRILIKFTLFKKLYPEYT